VSYFFLIVGSGYFGVMQQPAEMTLVIVAASISLAFLNLEKFERFSGAGFVAELRKNMEVMIDAQTEPVPEDSTRENGVEDVEISDLNKKVLLALKNPRYTWRYTAGIAQEQNIPRNRVQGSLDELSSQGLVVYGKGKKGIIWALSSEGRSLISAKKWEN